MLTTLENIHFMFHRKYITIEEYKKSIQKIEYQYLYKKDDELKGDVKNEGNNEEGNDFPKCRFNISKRGEG